MAQWDATSPSIRAFRLHRSPDFGSNTSAVLGRLRAWLKSRQPKTLGELLIVEFDDETVSVRVLADLEPGWNQHFRFADIKRVCFEGGGIFSSDVVYVSLTDREKPAVIPTEAGGGSELFGALCDRGYFPERVWRRAVADTSGGLHCWPEE